MSAEPDPAGSGSATRRLRRIGLFPLAVSPIRASPLVFQQKRAGTVRGRRDEGFEADSSSRMIDPKFLNRRLIRVIHFLGSEILGHEFQSVDIFSTIRMKNGVMQAKQRPWNSEQIYIYFFSHLITFCERFVYSFTICSVN